MPPSFAHGVKLARVAEDDLIEPLVVESEASAVVLGRVLGTRLERREEERKRSEAARVVANRDRLRIKRKRVSKPSFEQIARNRDFGGRGLSDAVEVDGLGRLSP